MVRAQSTLEFLMSYSWALIIIGIALAALVALGIFNPLSFGASTGQSGFSSVAPITQGYSLSTNGDFSVNLRNIAGVPIKILSVQAKHEETGVTKTQSIGHLVVNSGSESGILTVSGFGAQTAGSRYNMNLIISYEASGLNHTSTGKVWGTV